MEEGIFEESESLFEEAYSLRKKTLGAEHRLTIRAMIGWAHALAKLKKTDKARNIFEQALQIRT